MLKGISIYQREPGNRAESACNVIWQKGNARLLDFGGDSDAPAIFCIPSLINKSYVLDLNPQSSLIQHFLACGYRPLLLDWGEPGGREKKYDCADYVYELALDAFRTMRRRHRGPIHVMGYCMGGIFALALAQLESYYVDGLILLATPWDFSSMQGTMAGMDPETLDLFEASIMEQDTVPAVWIQTAFHMVNPWRFQEKFIKLSTMKPKERQQFLAIEAWVNDGVPLAKRVAKECLIDWPCHNTLFEGKWRISGWRIDPKKVSCPTFIAAPQNDRIVPLESSMPLADLIDDVEVIQPKSGHVSMIVGRSAEKQLWEPMTDWIDALHNS